MESVITKRLLAAFAVALIAPCSAVLLVAAADDASGPQPPCGAESNPPYPDLEHSPMVKVWDRSALGRDWNAARLPRMVCARIHDADLDRRAVSCGHGAEDLLQRIGAISGLTGIRYWSTTHQSWRTLIVSASAMAGPGRRHPSGLFRQRFGAGQRPIFSAER